MSRTKYELSEDKLRWQCDIAMFDFECTEDLAPLREFIGQDRAIRAIEFGLSMPYDGYNIYVAGLTGTGKTTAVKTHITKLLEEKQAADKIKPPQDWCYLHNFTDPDRPQIINLPKGNGKVFRNQIRDLMQQLKDELLKAFSSEEYKNEMKGIVEESQNEQEKLFDEVREEAQKQGFSFQMSSKGPVLIPLKEGKPIQQDEFMALEEQVRREIEEKHTELLKKLQDIFEKAKELEGKAKEKLMSNDKSVADFILSRLFDALKKQYESSQDIINYLDELKSYVLENPDIFKEEQEEQLPAFLGISAMNIRRGRDPFLPFQVNVFVDNSATEGLPVIIEPNPNFANLFGKIERRFLLGGYLSDHTMLKSGSLQLANGGYLLLSALDVLTNPGVWPALKRAIKTKELCIEEPFEQFGLVVPQGLRPQPMPIDIKVLLIGDGMLYQMLAMYDEDFWEIFKVKADFNFEVEKTKDNVMQFAAFISGCCEKCEMKHFDRTGVARVVEYSSRMVSDQEKLSSRFAQIRELVQEAEYFARKDNAPLVSGSHVEKAIEERFFRHNLPYERITEMIEQGTIMIDVDNAVVGQVNGLSVYSLGDVVFGKPSRITCKTFIGRGGVINIERESKLSGSTHDKGVLILSGYIGWKYAQENPLSLSASLCFEQSYEGIEGDSASSTELFALLSSVSGIPIKQNIAVTGSVNQQGEIQPIGGVNQKIEGFFQVCKVKGLSGNQGVMIPKKNVRNLMLRSEVIDAVKNSKFHIYAVSTVDEGIEVLTGVKAGRKRKDGTYPKDSVNYLVDKRLKEMASKLKNFHEPEAEEKKTTRPKK